VSIPEALRSEALGALQSWGCLLSDEQWRLLGAFLDDVLEHNKKANLTAARSLEDLLFRHALDGLAAVKPLRELAGGAAPDLVEVGAGAGFVGVSLKIAWPEARVRLVESSYKRFCFLNWTSARLRLKGLEIVHATVQKGKGMAADKGKKTLAAGGGADVVLARALAPLREALELTLPLARPGGAVLIYQSEAPSLDDPALAGVLASTGGKLESVIPYRLPREVRQRHMAVFRRSVCTG